jgi:hypothetical protein
MVIGMVASASVLITIAIAAAPRVAAGIVKMTTDSIVAVSILVADSLGQVAEFAHVGFVSH